MLGLVAKYREPLQRRANESPQLVAVLGLLDLDEDVMADHGYAIAKAALFRAGLRPAGWKALCRFGPALWEGVVGSSREAEESLEVVSLLSNSIASIKRSSLPPPELVRILVDGDGHLSAGARHGLFPARLLRAAWDRWLETPPHRRGAFLEETSKVVDWFHRANLRSVDLPKGVAWGWFQRRSDTWWIEQTLRVRRVQWPMPLTLAKRGKYSVVPIDSSWAAWEEARNMRHCLYDEQGRKGGPLESGRILAFSIRRAGAWKLKATFTARTKGPSHGWALAEIKGFANRKICGEVLRVAVDYLASQQSSGGSSPGVNSGFRMGHEGVHHGG
ncbi:MAG: hypothetical protein GX538_09125 [Gammaproteobacteria bacterium]|nr:hypothetical protein [Gammaproteobacteria bacterium]